MFFVISSYTQVTPYIPLFKICHDKKYFSEMKTTIFFIFILHSGYAVHTVSLTENLYSMYMKRTILKSFRCHASIYY